MKLTTTPRLSGRTTWINAAIFSMFVFSLPAFVQTAVALQPFEAPPVLSAKYLLPPEMISGPLFRVDEQVPTDGFMGTFHPSIGPRYLHGTGKRSAQDPDCGAVSHPATRSNEQDGYIPECSRRRGRPAG